MKRLCAIALIGLCFISSPAHAQTPATGRDYSDLWWNEAQSGWGMNVIHQDTILFITLFIYGTDRKPTWYVASNVAYVGTNASGDDTFRGDLFLTNGSPFNAVPFDAASTTASVVGSITFTGLASGGASVSYSVNDVANGAVAKSIVRQTWRTNAVASIQYVGSTSYTKTQCSNTAENNVSHDDQATYTLTVAGSTLRLVEDPGPGKVCNWNGSYAQSGRVGQSTGTIVCADGEFTYTFTELQVSPQAFGANFSVRGGADGCLAVGRIGGPRK